MKIFLIVSKAKGNVGCDDLNIIEDIIDGEKSILKVIKFFFVKKKNHASYTVYVCVRECISGRKPYILIYTHNLTGTAYEKCKNYCRWIKELLKIE